MHIKLFRALKAANLSDDAAAEVVEAIEEYIAVKVQEANKGIESKLTAQTWVIGSVSEGASRLAPTRPGCSPFHCRVRFDDGNGELICFVS